MLEETKMWKETHKYVKGDPDRYVELNDQIGPKRPTSIKRDLLKKNLKKT